MQNSQEHDRPDELTELPLELQSVVWQLAQAPYPNPPEDLTLRTVDHIQQYTLFNQKTEFGDVVEQIARLPEVPCAPDLIARTVLKCTPCLSADTRTSHRVKALQQERIKPLWLRPITNPFARMSAAALLLLTTGLLGNLDVAERVGIFFGSILGEENTQRLEVIIDRVLLVYGPVNVKENDLKRLLGESPLLEQSRSERLPVERPAIKSRDSSQGYIDLGMISST